MNLHSDYVTLEGIFVDTIGETPESVPGRIIIATPTIFGSDLPDVPWKPLSKDFSKKLWTEFSGAL